MKLFQTNPVDVNINDLAVGKVEQILQHIEPIKSVMRYSSSVESMFSYLAWARTNNLPGKDFAILSAKHLKPHGM